MAKIYIGENEIAGGSGGGAGISAEQYEKDHKVISTAITELQQSKADLSGVVTTSSFSSYQSTQNTKNSQQDSSISDISTRLVNKFAAID